MMRNHAKPANVSSDEWKERLRATMQKDRGRFRRHLWVLIGGIILLTVGLAWWILRQTPLPPLTIVAFDNVCLSGADAEVRAYAEAIEGEPAPPGLAGLDVVFADPAGAPLVRAKTDGSGQASAQFSPGGQGQEISFLVRLLGNRQISTAEDRARIFMLPEGAKIVLVDVNDLMAEPATDFAISDLNRIAVDEMRAKKLQGLVQRKHRIVYLAIKSERAAVYRLARRWVESKQRELPRGPILGRLAYHDQGTAAEARRQLINYLAARFTIVNPEW